MSDANGREPQLANATQQVPVSGREPALKKHNTTAEVNFDGERAILSYPMRSILTNEHVYIAHSPDHAFYVINAIGQILRISAIIFRPDGVPLPEFAERLTVLIEQEMVNREMHQGFPNLQDIVKNVLWDMISTNAHR